MQSHEANPPPPRAHPSSESRPQLEYPGRVPPQDIDAERAVLGSILLSNEAVYTAIEALQPDDFYRPAHQLIYRAMLDLVTRSEPVDNITLQAKLKGENQLEAVGGLAAIVELAEVVPTAAHIKHYAELVRDKATLRKLINASTQIATSAFEGGRADDVLDQAERMVFDVSMVKARRGVAPISDIVKDAFRRIEILYEQKKEITGVATGFIDVDRMTAGLQPSDLIIVAGRPSMGKTSFAINMGSNAALREQTGVAIFSLEMSKEQLVMRMLCSEGRIDLARMRGGFLEESDWPKLAKAAGTLSEAPMFIDDSGSLSVLEVRAKCRRIAAEKGLGLIIVDYLQLMRGSPNAQSREQEISEISRGLKSLAKELNVPVIALSQLNRSLEQRADKRPVLSDLRESGAIEQDADVIMFVYRDEVYEPKEENRGIAEIIIGKQRNGPIGTARAKFFHSYTRFDNLVDD
ncbi:MAG: replicative DNA helicase [Deltaproteobacteria bacterium]|nr:replicative DNA helicase [Deltaproteobacteria bacterium]